MVRLKHEYNYEKYIKKTYFNSTMVRLKHDKSKKQEM